MTDHTAPERIFAWSNNDDEDEYWDGVWMAYYTPSLPSQPDAEYIRADLLARAIQTALEMAKEADAEYWGQPSVVSKRISEIRVEDVLKKMEDADD